MVIPELNKLKHAITNATAESSYLPTLREDMLANIEQRWPSYEYNTTYAIANMVDPRYKDCAFECRIAAKNARRLVLDEMGRHCVPVNFPAESHTNTGDTQRSQPAALSQITSGDFFFMHMYSIEYTSTR